MIKTKTALALVGGGAIAYAFASSAAQKIQENIVFSIGSPQMDNTGFANGFIKLELPITVTNYNIFNINIKSFYGVVKYGEIQLSNVSFPFGFVLESGKTKTLSLKINIPVNSVLDDVLNALYSGNIFNTLINKIYLSGVVHLKTDVTSVNIPLENIAIPIV